MAVFAAAISSSSRANGWLARLRSLLALQRCNHTIVDGVGQGESHVYNLKADELKFHRWRKLDSRTLGINRSMIPAPAWSVVKILQSSGFDAYLVGGCVRDLLLNRIPKDFDVITNATLSQIKRRFNRCIIVGRRFPIGIVRVKGSDVEVSSFDTVARKAEEKDKFLASQTPIGYDEKDVCLWRNSMHRDFTINSLFFDPFANKIFDYSNALTDLKALKLRTLVPAHLSFKEDSARILRALRLAARLNLSIAKETDIAIRELSMSIKSLSTSRIMMELNYMLSYGAAEPSLCLLKRYNLLQILLPFHAAHLTEQSSKQCSQGSLMLMKLFFNLDLLVACDRPADSTLWISLLAFHLALVEDPQHILVVLTFASLLYHGNWSRSVSYSREHAEAAQTYAPEILDSCDFLSDDELAEGVSRFAAQVKDSVDLLTYSDRLLDAMGKFPHFPPADYVFVSGRMGIHVKSVFNHLVQTGAGVSNLKTNGRKSLEIDYKLLGIGDVRETRFALGRIILGTMVPKFILKGKFSEEEKDDLLKIDSLQKVENLEENCQTQVKLENSSFGNKDEKKHKVIGRGIDQRANKTSRREIVFVDQLQKETAEIKKDMVMDPSSNECLLPDHVSKEEKVESYQLSRTERRSCKSRANKTSKRKVMFVEQQKKETAEITKDMVMDLGSKECLFLDHVPKEEKVEADQLPRDGIRIILEDISCKCRQDDIIDKERKIVHNKKYQHSAQKHLKILYKVNDEAAQKGTSMQHRDFPLEETIERNIVSGSVESNSDHDLNEVLRSPPSKSEMTPKRNVRKLSSLFS